MMTAAMATTISDAVKAGDNPPAPPSTSRQGNQLLDEMNLAVAFAAMKGYTIAYINIQKFPQQVVDNSVDTLTGLGYSVNRDRERSYYELFVEWS